MSFLKGIADGVAKAGSTVATTAKSTADTVTGKKEIDKLKHDVEDEHKQLEAEKHAHEQTKRELKHVKDALEKSQLELSRERSLRSDLEYSLQSLREEQQAKEDADRAAKEAASRAEAEAEMTKFALEQFAKDKALANAKQAYESMGFVTTDSKLCSAILSGSNHEIQVLKSVYTSQFGKKLTSEVKSHTSGHIRSLLLGAMQTRFEFLASLLKAAIGTLTTDDVVLVDVLCSATNEELRKMKEQYQKDFGKDLVADVQKATSGTFEKLLTIVTMANRETGAVNNALVEADAAALYAAGEDRMIGVDEAPFLSILGNRSSEHLVALAEAYKRVSKKGHSLDYAIEKNFGGSVKRALLTIVYSNINRPAFFASLCSQSMEGLGCDEVALMRVLIARREVDMNEIREAYDKEHKTPLYQRLKEELTTKLFDATLANAVLLMIGAPL